MADLSIYKVPKSFNTKLLINNELVAAKGGAKIPVINPSTEEEICQVECATA